MFNILIKIQIKKVYIIIMRNKSLKEIHLYIKKLQKIEDNNGFLPSPFEIEPYIEEVRRKMYNKNGEMTKNDKKLDKLLKLEDLLCDFYKGAYEQ